MPVSTGMYLLLAGLRGCHLFLLVLPGKHDKTFIKASATCAIFCSTRELLFSRFDFFFYIFPMGFFFYLFDVIARRSSILRLMYYKIAILYCFLIVILVKYKEDDKTVIYCINKHFWLCL